MSSYLELRPLLGAPIRHLCSRFARQVGQVAGTGPLDHLLATRAPLVRLSEGESESNRNRSR